MPTAGSSLSSTTAAAPNGLELSRSAEAGKATHTLAPAGDQGKPHADSADQPGRHLDSPHQRAAGANLSGRPPSRLQRVVGRTQLRAFTCREAHRPTEWPRWHAT